MTATLITGGSGFIGSNLAHRLLSSGETVYIFDNLSRPNTLRNLKWLMAEHGDRPNFEFGDVRDRAALHRVVPRVDQVFHFAAQVAVTSSIEDPRNDFDVNAAGTLNLLEEIRSLENFPTLIYTSTNKVYGALHHLPVEIDGKRYRRTDAHAAGINESAPLDFHSPYGCSKGTAEQYILDYHRTFGLPTIVFRMSCIYGPHQYGTEDQGWGAHILSQTIQHKPVMIYGNGCQVRDLLFIEDLIDAFLTAQQHFPRLNGQAFNIGGGSQNTISLLELMDLLKEYGENPALSFSSWRTGDQKYFVSDCGKFERLTGWKPRVGVRQGIQELYRWLQDTYSVWDRHQPALSQAS